MNMPFTYVNVFRPRPLSIYICAYIHVSSSLLSFLTVYASPWDDILSINRTAEHKPKSMTSRTPLNDERGQRY